MARLLATFEAIVGERGEQIESALAELVEKTLVYDLPRELHEIYDLSVRIEIRKIRKSSLHAFFDAFMIGFTLLSGYKGIFDSIELIRDHAEYLLQELSSQFGKSVNVRLRITRRSRVSEYFSVYAFTFVLLMALAELAVIAWLVYYAIAIIYLAPAASPLPHTHK
jgi:hypothetical protein